MQSRCHYNDVIMGVIASQITSLTVVFSTVYSDADQRKHQSSASLAFVRGIHRGPVNSPHKWPVTRKMFPFHDVIMVTVVMMMTHTIYSRYLGRSVSHDLAYLKSMTSILWGVWCKAMSSDYAIFVTYGICCQKAINEWKLSLSYTQVSGWGCYGNDVCIYEVLYLTDLRSRASILYGFGAK